MTFLWPLTPEGKIWWRDHHEHFRSMVRYEQFDTLIFEIGWSRKLDLSVTFFDLWSLKERSDEEVTMNTFDHWFNTNNLTPKSLKSVEVENWTFLWPFLTFDLLRKGLKKRSPWILLIAGSIRTIWHLNLWNRLKLKIGPFCDLFWPLTP